MFVLSAYRGGWMGAVLFLELAEECGYYETAYDYINDQL